MAAEDALILWNGQQIPYDAIQQIDKTYFEKKGFFVITYQDGNGRPLRRKLSDRNYDNLAPILDHLIAQLS